MAAESRRVAVLGAGTMGVGIAVTAVRAGHEVLLHDLDERWVERGIDGVRRFLDRSVEKGKLAGEARDAALGRLRGAVALDDVRGCEIVIEAVPEDLALKQELLGTLDDVIADNALVHTNTSTLPVTAIAAGSRRPERVVGTHYCNPAPLMDLVELVRGQVTSADALAATRAYVEGIGKRVVECADVPGFIVNRFLVPFENDCIRALEAGMGTIDSIDCAVKDGLGYPMGTFRLLDIVGLDIHRAVSLSLYEQLRDPRFAPPPLVDRMISAGQLGRKAGRGFYSYDEPGLHGS